MMNGQIALIEKENIVVAGAPTVDGGTVNETKQESKQTRIISKVRAFGLQIPLLVGGSILLLASIFFVYWHITLNAPQYPQGLGIDVYVNKMEDYRNVREVDGLNHYIGMIKLTDAARFERAISVYAMAILAALTMGSLFLKGWWRTIARAPIVIFPIVFAADLFAWLYYAGHSLDDKAALSSSIAEFTPQILGEGTIGQFSTTANFETGFFMAIVASILVLTAILLDRKQIHREAPD